MSVPLVMGSRLGCFAAGVALAAGCGLLSDALSGQSPGFRRLQPTDHVAAPIVGVDPTVSISPQALLLAGSYRPGELESVLVLGAVGSDFLRNDGAGLLRREQARLTNRRVLDAVFEDLDGDGDRDIAMLLGSTGVVSATPVFLRATPTGYAADAAFAGLIGALNLLVSDIEAGDLDGDGDVDLLLDSAISAPRVLRNDGTGSFTVESVGAALFGFVQLSSLLDVDRDGDLDLVRYVQTGRLRAYENDGTGRFTPSIVLVGPPGAAGFTVSAWTVADMDSDGDDDLVIQEGRQTWILRNGAGGLQSASTTADLSGVQLLGTGDFDGDGQRELLTRSLVTDAVQIQRQTAAGWVDATAQWAPEIVGESVGSVCSLDADGDGATDLLMVDERGEVLLMLNELPPPGVAARLALALDPLLPRGSTSARDIAFGDLDGDGLSDMALATEDGAVFLRGNEEGAFRAAANGPVIAGPLTSIAVADLDGDGLVDVVAADASLSIGVLEVWFQGAGGTWTQGALAVPGRAGGIADLVLEDVTGDGRRDIVFTGFGAPRIMVQGAARSFTETVLPPAFANQVVTTDSDGDGDVDLLVSGPNGLEFLVNDGSGGFTVDTGRAFAGLQFLWGGAAAAADLDGDGDEDLLVSQNDAVGRDIVFWRNDGTGAYARTVLNTNASANHLVVFDADDDGDVDVVVQEGFPSPSLYLNNGSGAFIRLLGGDLGDVRGVMCAMDVDGDGDLDLAVGEGAAGGAEILVNVTRQLEVPRRVGPGGNLLVEGYWQGGGAALFWPAVVVGVAGPVVVPPLPVPGVEGLVRLNPSQVVSLPPFQVQGDAVPSTVAVPTLPSLSGLPFGVQGLWLPTPGAGAPRWSNVRLEVVR